MNIDRDKLLMRVKSDAAAGFDGNTGAGVASFHTKRDAVFAAVRHADHRYDGAAPDSQGMTRPEYVGRAALAALNSGGRMREAG